LSPIKLPERVRLGLSLIRRQLALPAPPVPVSEPGQELYTALSLFHRCRMGKIKAAVFPVPVLGLTDDIMFRQA